MIREQYNWGDQLDGTYRNPILQGDYSDPDIVRYGEKYYMISSTFQFHPGMTILESEDLINWEIIGSVIDNLSELDDNLNWNKMNAYGDGVYAGALRHIEWKEITLEGTMIYRSQWFVYTTIYSAGILVSTAEDIRGPWQTQYMKDCKNREVRVKGWDDNCPYWEYHDDGTLKAAYMVASKVNGAWYPHVFQMSIDGLTLLDGDKDFTEISGDFTREREGEDTVIHYQTGERINCTKSIGDAKRAAMLETGEILSVTKAIIMQGREGTVIRDIYTGEASKIFRFGENTEIGKSQIKTRHGNKEYVADYIYFFQSEVWPEEEGLVRVPILHRAKCIYGDRFDDKGKYLGPATQLRPGTFETQRLMMNRTLPFDDLEPNQGGYVDLPKEMAVDGREHWYFITHHGKEKILPHCRPVSLLPVEWVNGWPIPGYVGESDEDGSSIKPGVMQYHLPKPLINKKIAKILPQRSDDFSTEELSPFWLWNYVPCEGAYSLNIRKDALRMYAFPTIDGSDSFFKIPNVLSQRYLYGKQLCIEISMELAGLETGQEAGMVHFNGGQDSCRFGVRCMNESQLFFCLDGKIMERISSETKIVRLRSIVDKNGLNNYFYSLDTSSQFYPCDSCYKLKPGGYRGDSIGIYTYQNEQKKRGFVDFNYFHYMLSYQ